MDGGETHFLEGRMDASFGTHPLAMSRAIRLMASGLVDPARIITHRFPLDDAAEAFRVAADRTSGAIKVVLEP